MFFEQAPPPVERAEPTDLELFDALRQGDSAALATLMRRHWSAIVNYVARMRTSDGAEDIAQEVFARVWEHRSRWVPSGSPRAFLYRIARNLALKRLRYERLRAAMAPYVLHGPASASTPFDEASRAEFRAAFEHACGRLPVRRREAFILLRFHGLSLKEAAEVMGLAPQTVANHATRAAADLRSHLEHHLP